MQSCQRLFGCGELIRENWVTASSFRCPLHCFILLQDSTFVKTLVYREETVSKNCRLFGKQLTLDFLVICVTILQTETVKTVRIKSIELIILFCASVVENLCNLDDQG